MIWDHVAKSTGRVVIAATLFDAEFLGNRYLDVIDKVAVPDRLKDAVAKTKHQNVLNGFLAEIMIDAIDLTFFYQLQQIGIKTFCRFEIASKRLFINESPPVAILLFSKAVTDDLAGDLGKQIGRCREVIEVILGYLVLGRYLAHQIF